MSDPPLTQIKGELESFLPPDAGAGFNPAM